MKIEKFSGEHDFLSNFSPHPVTVEGMQFPTSEHAFQALKTENLDERTEIARKDTPGKAKRAGKKVTLRPSWNNTRTQFMELVLRAKFQQHPDIAQKLRETGDAELVEGNNWNDTFWGVCRGNGQNQLGRILMKIRAEL